MVAITALKVGDIVYSPERVKQGNTRLTKLIHYRVRITEVHDDYVMASWNSNSPTRFGPRAISRWRRSVSAK